MNFGPNPTAFDAPGPNPPRANETWTAYTFLTFCPDIGRTRRVAALLGVRWGYVLDNGVARPTPLERVDGTAWDRLTTTLHEHYSKWEFVKGMGER